MAITLRSTKGSALTHAELDGNFTDLNTNKADKVLAINNKTANHTLELADVYDAVEMNSASANTVTVPPNNSVAFVVGTQIIVIQQGAGQTTIAAGAGVTLRSRDGNLNISGQYGAATLIKRATDEWYVIGDLSA